MGVNRILIVDDELNVRRLLYEVARKAGYEAHTAENGLEALDKARSLKPSAILMDIKMPVMDGMEAFEIIHREIPEIAIILMTAYGTVETAVEAMQRGAFDYLVKPSNVNEVRLTLERAFQMKHLRETVATLRTVIEEKDQPGPIVGRSTAIQQVYKAIGRVSQTNATVLIAGESGSGKGLVARIIHNNSSRYTEPFIEVNCGAIPDGLMESELFGHERGAFTGAVARKLGRFELADHGTLFLDEVGELPLPLQVKLLRVLQEREFERVGGTETIRVDVRVIAATNRDLTEMVRQGTFREDLYYRLKVIPIDVPPLRERKEDIPSFVDYYLQRFAAELHQERPCITNEALILLQEYHWPGNVRELANVLERSVIMCGGVIGVEDLSGLTALAPEGMISVPYSGTLKDVLHKVEKEMILRALAKNGGNKVKTAQALDISRRALLYKLDEYGYGGAAKR